jgi:hypothetical protein
MAVSPKCQVKWSKTGSTTEKISAKTYDDLFKVFQKKNAAKEEWGRFSMVPKKPAIAFKPNDGGPITDVVLTWGYETMLPKWDAPKNNPKAKAAWDTMIKALEKHEEKHRLFMLEQVAMFSEKVINSQDLSKAQLATLLGEMTAGITKAQKEFDDRTANGEKEGVFLPAPDKVKEP